MLVFGLLLKFGLISDPFYLTPRFQTFQHPLFLIIVGALFLLETFGDKVPVCDHLLDLVHTILKPLAGAFLGFVAASGLRPEESYSLAALTGAIAGGGAVALMSHTSKAALRCACTPMTGGMGNMFLSGAEDLLAIAGTILAAKAPWLIGVVIALFILAFVVCAPFLLRTLGK